MFTLLAIADTQPTYTTFSGEVTLYYLLPIMVFLTVSLLGFGVWVVKKINGQDTALALLIVEVNPPDKPSLRDLITDVRTKQSNMQAVADDRDKRRDN